MANQTKLLQDRTCLITGGSSGIGKGTAAVFAQQGARIIITGRDAQRGQEAVSAIQSASGNPNVSWMPVDFLSLRSIHEFAKHCSDRIDRLDLLINNAGGLFAKRGESADGVEKTLALNVLAPFVLTQALWPLLQKAPQGRVLNVATKISPKTPLDIQDIQRKKKYSGFTAYAQAKLALIMWTKEMADRRKGDGVTVGCLHPGIVPGTEFGKELPRWLMKFGDFIAKLFRMSTSMEDSTKMFLALAQEIPSEELHGSYFVDGKFVPLPIRAQDAQARQELWQMLERLQHGQ